MVGGPALMASRLIRDDMLDSERVQTLPIEARWLYVAVLLIADDAGLFEVNVFKLGRRAGIDQSKVPVLVQCLADADLVRLYEADGKRFGFIPRFRQRLQIKRTKHPLPPLSLVTDDEDATSKIKHLAANPPLDNRAPPLSTVVQPSEPEPEPKEKKISVASQPRQQRKAADRTPPCPFEGIVGAYHEVLPELPRVRVMDEARKKAIKALWTFVMTSTKSDGARRATDAAAGMSWLRDYFARVRENDWLMGRGQRAAGHESWRCTLDFLCSSKGLKAVIERTESAA